jgi:hypothetical protein
MLAFYGVLLISLSQQVQSYHQKAIDGLKLTDAAIRRFSQITEPKSVSWANWSIPFEQESNVWDIMSREHWVNSPMEVFNSTIASINGNYSEAVLEDFQIRDWLNSRNLTRFRANYNLVSFSLHDLVRMIYEEFPPPPAKYNYREVLCFVSSNLSEIQPSFQNWVQRYNSYYAGVSEARSSISEALDGMSEAEVDAAKSDFQLLEDYRNMSNIDYWFVQTITEDMNYRYAMSTYYESVFEPLNAIYSSANDVEPNVELYTELYNVAFSSIQYPTMPMVIFGVIIPMILLGISEHFEKASWTFPWVSRIKVSKQAWQWFCFSLIIVCVIGFVAATYCSVNVIWTQITKLYLT